VGKIKTSTILGVKSSKKCFFLKKKIFEKKKILVQKSTFCETENRSKNGIFALLTTQIVDVLIFHTGSGGISWFGLKTFF
jgi:hypothetical protein